MTPTLREAPAARVAAAVLSATVLAVPFAYLRGPLFVEPKVWLSIAGLTAACALTLVSLLRRESCGPRTDVRWWPTALVVMALATMSVLLLRSGHELPTALRVLSSYLVVVAGFTLGAQARWAGPVAARALSLATVGVALLVLAEEYGWFLPGLRVWEDSPGTSLGHRNIAAHLLMAGLPIALAGALDPRAQTRPAWRSAAACGLLIAALVATRSRAAFVAGALSSVLLVIGLLRRGSIRKTGLVLTLCAALVGLVAHARSPMVRGPARTSQAAAPSQPMLDVLELAQASVVPLFGTLQETHNPRLARPLLERIFSKEVLLASLGERTYIWKVALEAIAAHPWSGLGPGRFRDFSVHFFNAHNLWLHIGVEFGVIALLLFAGLTLVLWVRAGRAVLRSDGNSDTLVAACIVLAYLVSGALDVGAFHWGSNLVFGMFAGVLQLQRTKMRSEAAAS